MAVKKQKTSPISINQKIDYKDIDLLIAGRLAWASRIHLNTYRALMLEGMRVIRCG